MVLVLAKCGKISDVQAARSAVTDVLKRLFQLSGKAVCFGQKQKGQMGDFRLLERSFSIYFMDLAKKW